MPNYNYSLPDPAKLLMKENRIICVELLDEMFEKALGIHFLEPKVSFDVKYRVKPVIAKVNIKPEKAEALNYMKKIERKTEESEAVEKQKTVKPAAELRKEQQEIKPKLGLALRLQVTKQDLNSRPYYQEVAEVFEEILQATEKGLDYLPKRLSKMPGQIHNEVKEAKIRKQKEEQELKALKEEKRRKRHDEIKEYITESNFGGRGEPTAVFRYNQQQLKEQEKKKKEAQAREKFLKRSHVDKQKVGVHREENMSELQDKRVEEAKLEQDKKVKVEQDRKDFLKKQKQKITEEFQGTYKRRDMILLSHEEANKAAKDNEKLLKDQIEEMMQTTKEDREFERKEREAIEEFMANADVEEVFMVYERQLKFVYKFYASMDLQKENTFDIEYLHSALSLREFVRFGYQTKIVPQFVSPDDMVFIYKCLVHETRDDIAEKKTLTALERQHKKSGQIDYLMFLKGLVRICVNAQEKLAGVNKESLAAVLERQAAKSAFAEGARKRAREQAQKRDGKRAAEMEELKKQFQEEQQARDQRLSRKAKGKDELDPNSLTLTGQTKVKLRQLDLDEQRLGQEDEFFQKWLKQRENRTGSVAARNNSVVRQNSQGSATRSGALSGSMVSKKKDLT